VATLAELRLQKVLSQQELADAAKVGKSTVHEIERGHRVPHPRTRRALAAALGIEPNQIDWPAVGGSSKSGKA